MKMYVTHSAAPTQYQITRQAPKVHYFPHNKKGRDFVVGDIHGCLSMVQDLLRQCKFNVSIDRLFATGDLIDRGPESEQCLLLISKPWFHSVRGNHEQMLINAVNALSGSDTRDIEMWMYNGGEWAANIEDTRIKKLAKLASFLPLVIVVGSGVTRYNICHAEMVKAKTTFSDQTIDNWDLTDSDEKRLIWGRNLIERNPNKKTRNVHDGLSLTYVGHTPNTKHNIISRGQHVYLDTGGVFNHNHGAEEHALSMVDVYTGDIYQAQR